MLSAWYLHLNIKWFNNKAFFWAALFSWAIAFFEYQFHIPANRIGDKVFSLGQLQLLQVIISLIMFIPFSMFVLKKPWDSDYFIAMIFMCIGAYFIFRSKF